MSSLQQIKESNILAVDLGGTLTKVAVSYQENLAKKVFSSLFSTKIDCMKISFERFLKKNKLVIEFATFAKVDEFFNFLYTEILENFENLKILATGGGAFKHQDKFKQILEKAHEKSKHFELKVEMNEFETIIPSIQALIDHKAKILLKKGQSIIDNLIIQSQKLNNKTKINPSNNLQVPLILANIGSGMSVLKLQRYQQGKLAFTRIGGSALGGGFLFGLEKIINENFSFQKFQSNSLTFEELYIMKSCIKNLSQIITLYSDIHQINRILITGGMVKAKVIKNEFIQNLSNKDLFFTEIDGFLSVFGMVFSEWKKANPQ